MHERQPLSVTDDIVYINRLKKLFMADTIKDISTHGLQHNIPDQEPLTKFLPGRFREINTKYIRMCCLNEFMI